MTRLFGGFGSAFYAAYEETWPLAAGWERRVPLYQLYHVLNHCNIFGGAYHGRALELLRTLT
jgi:fructosamine-3-kinase